MLNLYLEGEAQKQEEHLFANKGAYQESAVIPEEDIQPNVLSSKPKFDDSVNTVDKKTVDEISKKLESETRA